MTSMNVGASTKITATELKQALDEGRAIRMVDVRTPAEYGSVHIEGSALLPLDGLAPEEFKEAGTCVLICQSGARADKAARMLAAAGCHDFRVLDGGVAAWRGCGYAVVEGSFALPLDRQVRIVAGLLVVIGVVLGWRVHPGFYGLSAFVGCGLVMVGITDWCPMALLIARMPWNQRGCGSCCGGCSGAGGCPD